MLGRACAGLRAWGTGGRTGARRGTGLGRLRQPAVLGSFSLPELQRPHSPALARDAGGAPRGAQSRALSAPGPAFGSRVSGLRAVAPGSEPALVSGSSLEPDTR